MTAKMESIQAIGFAHKVDPRFLTRMVPGDHLSCVYGSREELGPLVAAFVEEGLRRQDRILCMAEEGFLPTLRHVRTSPEPFFERIQGKDPQEWALLLDQEIQRSIPSGDSSVRLIFEMGQIGPIPWESWLCLESGWLCLSSSKGYVGLFLWPRILSEPDRLMDLILLHPHALFGTQTVANLRFHSPSLESPSRPSSNLDCWMQAHEDLSILYGDMSDYQKRCESQFRELQALTSLISHDLRTPIWCIQNLAQTLLEDQTSLFDREACTCVESIRESVNEMTLLLDVFSVYSRVESMTFKPSEISLSDLVAECAADFTGILTIRALDLPGCWGDRSLLRSVLQFCMGNAAHSLASRESGVMELTGERSSLETVLRIRDPENLLHLSDQDGTFDLWEWRRSARGSGVVGIRFASIQKIVARHGGRLWVIKDPEGVFSLCFSLPEEGISDLKFETSCQSSL